MMRQKVTILADDYDAYNNNSFTPYGYIIRYIFCLHKHYFLKYTVTQFSWDYDNLLGCISVEKEDNNNNYFAYVFKSFLPKH